MAIICVTSSRWYLSLFTNKSKCQNNMSDIHERAKIILRKMGPKRQKSVDEYHRQYQHFKQWMEKEKIGEIDEHVLLVYFNHIIDDLKRKPSCLWPLFSKLKHTLLQEEGVDISKYHILKKFNK